MERRLGEVFKYKDIKLKVKETKKNNKCKGCYFYNDKGICTRGMGECVVGFCSKYSRYDKTYIIFEETQEVVKMERKLGEIFEDRGEKLKVEISNPDNVCKGCFYYDANNIDCKADEEDYICCGKTNRSDNEDIIYKKVTDLKDSHYKQGKYESIDMIKSVLGDNIYAFCIGNAMKYITRAEHKGSKEEDLFKAENYLHYLRTGEWIND